MAARIIKVREMDPLAGDRVTTMTPEEVVHLDLLAMTTVLPGGRVVTSLSELLDFARDYQEEELELIRFPAMRGG